MILGTSRLLNFINIETVSKVIIDNSNLEYETCFKNLGLRIMNNLSWTEQVHYIHKKVYQCLYQFKRLCFNPPEKVRKMLVLSLIFPIFDYACVAFCGISNTLITKLQRAQNACIRFIFRLQLHDHVTQYYKRLGVLKIKERLEYNILTLANKTLKRKEPLYLFENYRFMRDIHLRETRFGNTVLQYPIHRTVIYTNSFLVQSIRLLNSLENEIKDCDSEKVFAKKLKVNLLKRYDSLF
jgi:hypothetical protein